MRRRVSHIFYKMSLQKGLRLTGLKAGRPLPPEKFLKHIYLRGIVRPKRVHELENPVTSEVEPATFWHPA